jgi:hypothetical protein
MIEKISTEDLIESHSINCDTGERITVSDYYIYRKFD